MAKHKNYFYANATNQAVLGQFGLRVLTTDAIVGETFVAIQVLTDATISAKLTENEESEIGDDTITSLDLTAGTVIYGRFIDLIVESGKVIAYKG
jgi:hypothetical protein